MDRDVYHGCLRVFGKEHARTITAAICYANSLVQRRRFVEVKVLMRKTIPVAGRFLGENSNFTLKMRWIYAMALYEDPAATLDDVRKGVEILESVAPLWTRIFGPAHPETPLVQGALKLARELLPTYVAASSSGAK